MKLTNKNSLKHKILIYTVMISSIMSTVFTVSSLFLDYKIDSGKMEEKIRQIELTTLGSLKGSLWDLNVNLINVLLHDLIQIEGIEEINLVDELGKEIVHLKSQKNSSQFTFLSRVRKEYKLNFDIDGKEVYGGTFWLEYSKDHIFRDILRRAFVVFFTQTLKTLVVCLMLLFIYEKLITKDLIAISSFLSRLNIKSLDEVIFKYEKREQDDEISIIQSQIEKISKELVKLNNENKLLLEQANLEKKMQEAKALNAVRLASLGEMATGIAHEINNPLTIIKSSSYRLYKLIQPLNLEVSQEIDKNFDRVNTAIERIVKIIRNMKKISRDGSEEELRPQALSLLIEDTVDYYQEKFRNADIDFQIDGITDDLVLVRDVEFSQILMNLLNNSFDAISELSEKWIKLTIESDRNYVEISLIDSGKGIPLEIATKIFNPFFTTKEIGKGTGLGLSISKEAIENMGGEIYIDHQCSNTKFVIKLRKIS